MSAVFARRNIELAWGAGKGLEVVASPSSSFSSSSSLSLSVINRDLGIHMELRLMFRKLKDRVFAGCCQFVCRCSLTFTVSDSSSNSLVLMTCPKSAGVSSVFWLSESIAFDWADINHCQFLLDNILESFYLFIFFFLICFLKNQNKKNLRKQTNECSYGIMWK